VKVGVLALQGAFARHAEVLRELAVEPVEIRSPDQLDVDALVLPGGESTTMSFLLDSSGLREPVAELLRGGMPALGTCAGLILLATEVLDGRPDQASFGVLPCSVRRNAYGRQNESFEEQLLLAGDEPGAAPVHGVFIRAPRIEAVGEGVEVLSSLDGSPVLVARGSVMGATFHPELSGDARVHELFLGRVAGRATGSRAENAASNEREHP
jgi:5'-phosphate synthase pdxT subunit